LTPVVDLHLHTTASDGRLTPRQLVERAAAAGVTVMAATDHDTVAAVEDVRSAAAEYGIEAIAGIEVTAVAAGRDIHILGYFVDPADRALGEFLATQRQRRIARVEAIAARLAALGVPIDVAPLLQRAQRESGKSIGRPQVAAAMIAAGYVRDTSEAFDRWLAGDRPGFVAREGPSPGEVIAMIHAAGGLASLAHPGKTGIDDRISELRAAGLDALEAFHPDHDEPARSRYARMAAGLGCLVTGGSDFHGDPAHGREPGTMTMPAADWQRLRAAAPHA
jgi:predicted metal-dependent phosphoesterase TrpH